MFLKGFAGFLGAAAFLACPFAQAGKNEAPRSGKTVVLETQTIEGKIKRPQAALLSLEKRPVFKPMALTQIDVRKNIVKDVDPAVFENKTYTRPFMPDNRP